MAANAKPFILYNNIYTLGTPTATDTAAGYDVSNIKDYRAFTLWRAASAGTKYLTINAGSAQNFDTLGILGHNFATASATVSVEHSTNGSSWTDISGAGFFSFRIRGQSLLGRSRLFPLQSARGKRMHQRITILHG